MTRSLKLLASSLSLLVGVSCSHFAFSDWPAGITLPASEDCYQFHVLSGKEVRTPAEDPKCKAMKAKSIWLTYESYKLLRRDIEVNCQLNQCTQIKGALDGLFLALDKAFQAIPQ